MAINPTLAAAPSGAAYVAARTAFEAAIAQHGAQSSQAQQAGVAAVRASTQCSRELGNVVPYIPGISNP